MRATISAEFRNWRSMQQIRNFDGSAPTYWLAKLVGFCGSGFRRKFIQAVIDRSQANSVESRGVMYYWHINDGLYEGVFCQNFERQYIIVNSAKIEYITKEMAQEWLNDFLENQF